MSQVLKARKIAELALRKVGAIVPSQRPDSARLSVALSCLDLIVGELGGTHKFEWLTPARQTVTLTSGVSEYNLNNLLSPDFQFFYSAGLLTSATDDSEEPVELIHQSDYDLIVDKTLSGTPDVAYIERNDTPRLFIYPVPTTSMSLILRGGQYTNQITSAGADTGNEIGGENTGFPAAWNRYLLFRLAKDIGDGPVARLPIARLESWERDIERAWTGLNVYNNRQQTRLPIVTHPWSF